MHATPSRYAAPWSKTLVWSSAIATAILLGVTVLTMQSVCGAPPAVRWTGWIPLIVLGGSAPFVVRSYRIDNGELFIRRLCWETRIPLAGLMAADVVDRSAFKGTLRLCGNGGLYSFTGWYRSKTLGSFRMYATGFDPAVVLRFQNRAIVVSPSAPQAFSAAALAASRETQPR
jgi:hypothetical protein